MLWEAIPGPVAPQAVSGHHGCVLEGPVGAARGPGELRATAHGAHGAHGEHAPAIIFDRKK